MLGDPGTFHPWSLFRWWHELFSNPQSSTGTCNFFIQGIYISAVKYLLSPDPLPQSSKLELVSSNHQFYLYQNLDSWSYFYLAGRIETISGYEDLHNAEKGTAYLWETGPEISISSQTQDNPGTVKLSLYEFDRMEFDYSSDTSEFLIISDTWHPNWKAQVNGIDTEIVKANGVFKGILLPPGKGKVQLHFDNSSYKTGIWISLAGWILFIGSWIGFTRKPRALATLGSPDLAS